jgi:lipopolysaccharide heptosyltransferase I
VPDPRRILLIRPSALGDVCRSVPLLASLRRAFPDATIDWLVQDSFADAVRHHPALDAAIPFPRAELGRSGRRADLRPTLAWMNRALRPRPRYDLVIDAQGLFRSGLFAWWTGARARVGYRNAEEMGRLFLNRAARIDRSRHAVDRMLALLPLAGVDPVPDMRLHAASDELAWVDRQPWASPSARARSVSDGRIGNGFVGRPVADAPGACCTPGPLARPAPFAVLAPTSRWPGKQWPAERFAELARRLLGAGVPHLVIVGGPAERSQIAPLLAWGAHEPRVIDLVGETSIARLLAIIARSSLVVANDSAALHMAVGFDRPLVALFGPTRVGLVGPYRRDPDVIQHTRPGDRFDHKNAETGRAMMERITVEEVVAACLTRLHPPASVDPRAED